MADGKKMNFSLRATTLAASCCLLFVLYLFGAAESAKGSANWNQWGHDASRSSYTNARGPIWPTIVSDWTANCTCVFGPVVSEVRLPGTQFPQNAIFSSSHVSSTVHGHGSDGQPLPGNWPADLVPGSHALYDGPGFPVVGRQNGEPVIFTATRGAYSSDLRPPIPASVYALTLDGRPAPGAWPWSMPAIKIRSYPTLASQSSRGRTKQILYVATSKENDVGGRLYALNIDGTPLGEGWPAAIGYPTGYQNGPAVSSTGSVYIAATVDEDRSFVPTLHGFRSDGNRKPGWPYRFEGKAPYFFSHSGPAVGRDGSVYVAGWEIRDGDSGDYDNTVSTLYAFRPNGTLKRGWPIQVDGDVTTTPAVWRNGTVFFSVRLRTSARNHKGRIYAFDRNGKAKPGWPLRFQFDGPNPLGPDISGLALDRRGNIYFGYGRDLYGYRTVGTRRPTPLPGWPVTVAGENVLSSSHPALADDGTLYINTTYMDDSGGFPSYFTQIHTIRSGSRP